jgi:hypothetical protein
LAFRAAPRRSSRRARPGSVRPLRLPLSARPRDACPVRSRIGPCPPDPPSPKQGNCLMTPGTPGRSNSSHAGRPWGRSDDRAAEMTHRDDPPVSGDRRTGDPVRRARAHVVLSATSCRPRAGDRPDRLNFWRWASRSPCCCRSAGAPCRRLARDPRAGGGSPSA